MFIGMGPKIKKKKKERERKRGKQSNIKLRCSQRSEVRIKIIRKNYNKLMDFYLI